MRDFLPSTPRQWLFGVSMLILGVAGAYFLPGKSIRAPESPANPNKSTSVGSTHVLVHFSASKQAAGGVKVAPAKRRNLADGVWVTGKIALNEDRLAHVYPLVEGVVRDVPVQFGQEVKSGQMLAMLDSKEVGAAKLELVKNRLNVGFSEINHDWNKTIEHNTQSLIGALLQQVPVLDIEERFRDQPMGDYREQLVSSYSRMNQTRADYDRIKGLFEQNVMTEKDYIKARTDHEAATAAYQANIEGIKFAARQQLLASEQKAKEALTAQSVSESLLLILGYRQDEIDRMDPLEEGESVAHYPISAPLDGTVIAKDIVLLEHVAPQMQLFQIADLRTVWIRADIFEKDVPLLHGLHDKTLRFKAGGYPDREFEARVTYTGDVVDENARAVRLLAVAQNPDRLLKPGMFVQVRIPAGAARSVLAAPASAVQQHENRSFVFVQRSADSFERRDVQTGRQVDGMVEIAAGLSAGDRVVERGGFALKSEMLRELMTGD